MKEAIQVISPKTVKTLESIIDPEKVCLLSRAGMRSLLLDVSVPYHLRMVRRNRFNEVEGYYKGKSRDNFKQYDIDTNLDEMMTRVFTRPYRIPKSRSSQHIIDGFHGDKFVRLTSILAAELANSKLL